VFRRFKKYKSGVKMKRLLVLSIFVANALVASEGNWIDVPGRKHKPIPAGLNSFNIDLCVDEQSKDVSVTPVAIVSEDLELVETDMPYVVEEEIIIFVKNTQRKKHLRDKAIYFLKEKNGQKTFRELSQVEHMHCKKAALQLGLSTGNVANMCKAVVIAQHTTTAEACDYLTEKLSLQELKELISRTKNERFYLPGIDKSRVNKDKSRQQALDFSDLSNDVSFQPRKGFTPKYSLADRLLDEQLSL